MTQTYAVLKTNGETIDTDLTAAEAAQAILSDDGQDYEIRPSSDYPGFDLWTRKQVANRGWHKTVIFSLETDADKAEAEICERVIHANWQNEPFAMTMEAYKEMLAE